MSGSNVTVARKEGKSTLVRARFAPGMLLQHEDLEQLGSYPRELSRLLFRSFFGCGVVCGLTVRVETNCGKVWVVVGPGLALDCAGDPVYVPAEVRLVLDEDCDPSLTGPFWVLLCGTTKCCAPRPAACPGDDDEAPPVCTRERDGFEIRLTSARPECVCGCPEQTPMAVPGTSPSLSSSAGSHSVAWSESTVEQPRCGSECRCVSPNHPCYRSHYRGECGCGDGCNCGCGDCILLARLEKDRAGVWGWDYRVRRFIRPLLMCDPLVEEPGPVVAMQSINLKEGKNAEKPARAAKPATRAAKAAKPAGKVARAPRTAKPLKPAKPRRP